MLEKENYPNPLYRKESLNSGYKGFTKGKTEKEKDKDKCKFF